MSMAAWILLTLLALVTTAHTETEVCVKSDSGGSYKGTKNFTLSGKSCVLWKDVLSSSSGFPENSLNDALNYCRNPDGKKNNGLVQPYCYTDSVQKTTEFCNVPECNAKTDVQMIAKTCRSDQPQFGYMAGDVVTLYSENYPTKTKGMVFPGCKAVFEGCKKCKFYVKVEANLPACNSVTSSYNSLQCPENCQSISVKDGSYNSTIGKIFVRPASPVEKVTGEFWSTSNNIIIQYCQMNSAIAEQGASFMVTVYTVAKEEHFGDSSGVIKSPNFPHGYFSRSEIYEYSVQAPFSPIDTNMTLLFYDWDLNASAGSKVTIRWGGDLTQSLEYVAGPKKLIRPALLIPSPRFNITFETGDITNWRKDQVVGFLARYNTFKGDVWADKPDTNCGGYLTVLESWGGHLEYDKSDDGTNVTDKYIDCIWVIPMPPKFTNLEYKLEKYYKDPAADLTLTLRDGVTSEDKDLFLSIPMLNAKSVRGRGLFLHLSGSYQTKVSLKFSYHSFVKPTDGHSCESGAFYCPEYGYCMSTALFQQYGVAKCKVDVAKPTVSPVWCNAYGRFACHDRSSCFNTLQKCNGVKDCKDGSDELECAPPVAPKDDSNVAAIVAPIVVIFILLPVIAISIYLCKKKADEEKDEELKINKQELLNKKNNRASVQGFDNYALELDDVPISVIAREEKARSRENLDGAVGGAPSNAQVQFHPPPAHPVPRETQSYRELSAMDRAGPPPRGTQSYRFPLPSDIDTITELPEEPVNPRSRSQRPPESPTTPPADRPRQYRKRNEKPMTLADYRPGSDPKKRHPPPEEDRTPEGRSFRGDQPPPRQPSPMKEPYNGPRSPGDGSSGSLSPMYEKPRNSRGPKRPGDHLPHRETQSYREPPTNYDYDPEPPRSAMSYRFQPDDGVVLKPGYDPLHQGVRPKTRPKEISGAHKKTLGQYRPRGPEEKGPSKDPSYSKPQPRDDGSADELRAASYRIMSGSKPDLRTSNESLGPAIELETSGATSI